MLLQLQLEPPVSASPRTGGYLGNASSNVVASASSDRISIMVWSAAARLLPSWCRTGVKVPIWEILAGESESVRK